MPKKHTRTQREARRRSQENGTSYQQELQKLRQQQVPPSNPVAEDSAPLTREKVEAILAAAREWNIDESADLKNANLRGVDLSNLNQCSYWWRTAGMPPDRQYHQHLGNRGLF